LQTDLKRNYLAVYDLGKNSILQLETEALPTVIQTNEGDGERFIGLSDTGRRVESQWTGRIKRDLYSINVNDGTKKLVLKNAFIFTTPQWQSPDGKYFLWYDMYAKNYFVYDGDSIRNITSKIKLPLWNEENDVPDLPGPYGVMGWHEGDSAVYVYDRYDVWKVDLTDKLISNNYFSKFSGRSHKIVTRYVSTDPEKRFFKNNEDFLIRRFSEETKKSNYTIYTPGENSGEYLEKYSFGFPVKAKNAKVAIFTKENYNEPPNLFLYSDTEVIMNVPAHPQPDGIILSGIQLSSINPQQKDYNWGTAELFKWKAYNGKESMGIVYKPEDFDPMKKYPMICYFYETLSDGLYSYQAPSPTPSRLNIPFFVSRGYVVFVPDIHYGTGHPGRDAYNYIVSGARAVVKKGFVDSTRVGLQGQSWGGYQVAYLITATNFFKAAWAGAPVVNMTSAYGGIRWESGLNRQFQYEKSQSRIGASLWEKPELYIENSPLFHLPKVKTPLVIMSNDADGAVPWYQGIEFFTAMRRLGKPVWLLVYNGEAHNLVERKNRKDIQIREQQYFDWLLKDAKPPKWITEGVPAVKKGKDWGFELSDQ
jgi:dienelactone hydrolase